MLALHHWSVYDDMSKHELTQILSNSRIVTDNAVDSTTCSTCFNLAGGLTELFVKSSVSNFTIEKYPVLLTVRKFCPTTAQTQYCNETCLEVFSLFFYEDFVY